MEKPKKDAVIIPISRGAEIMAEKQKKDREKIIQQVLRNSKDFGKE